MRRVAALAVVDWSVGGVGELNRFGISWSHVTNGSTDKMSAIGRVTRHLLASL